MTDEECIALAALHGAKFWPSRAEAAAYFEKYNLVPTYWAIDRGFNENMSCQYEDLSPAYSKAATIGEAARLYCARHGLLDGVT